MSTTHRLTTDRQDSVEATIRYVVRGEKAVFYPSDRWYYVPRMEPEEVLAFKRLDSDRARVQWTGHTAFDDPTAAPDAPPRESIEIRTISFIT